MEKGKEILRRIQRSRDMYDAYNPDVWVKQTFYDSTGGYVVINRKRLEHSRINYTETAKFEKELIMSETFAKNGDRIEMLEEKANQSSYDVNINGIPGDLKYVTSHKGILRNAKRAIGGQKASFVLFKFDEMTPAIMGGIKALASMNIHGKYIIKGRDIVSVF